MKNNMVTRSNPFGLIDPFFDEFFTGESNSFGSNLMKTDIKDKKDHYEFKVEVPDVKKEDIKLSLNDGYLTIEAKRNYSNDEKDEDGSYVRRERYFGSSKRSFYVGEDISQEDIKAKLEDGVLSLHINKVEPVEEEQTYIPIE